MDLSVVIHNIQHITHDVIVNDRLLNSDRNLSMTLISEAFASATCYIAKVLHVKVAELPLQRFLSPHFVSTSRNVCHKILQGSS